MPNTFKKISLSDDAQKKLVGRLKEMISAAEEYHSQWEDLHEKYLRQYLCQPEHRVKTYPWKNASNLYPPLGRIIQDGIMAQLHDAMFGNDPLIKVKASKVSSLHRADALSLFYGDYVYKKLINLRYLGNDWNHLTLLDGTGVTRSRWDRSRQLKRNLMPSFKPKYGQSESAELFGIDVSAPRPVIGMEESITEEVTVERRDRPVVEVMDTSKLFIAPDTTNGLQYPQCPWYYVVNDLGWDQLICRRRDGYDNIDEALRATLGNRTVEDIERLKRDNEDLSQGTVLKTTEVIEFYMRLVLPAEYEYDGEKKTQAFDDDGYAEEVVVTYLPATEKIARIVPLWRVRPDGRRPDIPNFFNRIPGRFYGQGVQAKMYHLNEMMMTLDNQMIDYGTLQNMPFYFYVPHLANLADLTSLSPGQGIPIGDTRGVMFNRMNGDQNFFLNAHQVIQQYAERDGQISDQTMGRIPEKAANKTARGMMIAQQGMNTVFRRVASLMSEAYVEMFYAVHALYKFHAPPEIVFKVTDAKGANFEEMKVSRADLSQELDFEMVLNPDRGAEQQTAQALFQLVMSIPYIAQNPFSVRAAAKHLYDTIGYGNGRRNFDEIWPEEMTPQIVAQQQQQLAAQQGVNAPFGGQPTPPQPGMMPPPQLGTGTPPPMPPPESTPIEEEDIGVKL